MTGDPEREILEDVVQFARQFAPASPALEERIQRLDRARREPEDARYDAAIREWVARRLRGRGHTEYTRDMIRDVRFELEEGWPGTDVTPGDDDYAAVRCQIKRGAKWADHAENIEDTSPVTLVRECLGIYAEIMKGDA